MTTFNPEPFFKHQKRKPRNEWKASSYSKAKSVDLSKLKPIEKDLSICEFCGGTGVMKFKSGLNRTSYKTCNHTGE
jgi:hypothetical protein